jgi:hypothetical protein
MAEVFSIGKNMEGSVMETLLGNMLGLAWRDLKSHEELKTFGDPAEIQKYVPNVRVRRYRYVNPLDAGMEGDANGKQTSVI